MVTIIDLTCPICGVEYKTSAARTRKKPACSRACALILRGQKIKIGRLKTTTADFIARAREVHGNTYDYSRAQYIGSKIKLCIICRKHGEFWQQPCNHLNQKQGCPKCGTDKSAATRRLNQDNFISRCENIHGNKYDYSKVEYHDCEKKICIICPKHGEFYQAPINHLFAKQGCPKCGIESRTKTQSLTKEGFIERAIAKHGNKYCYDKVQYKNNSTLVIIICRKHGEFRQRPCGHLNGKGCMLCAQEDARLSQNEFIERATKLHGGKYNYNTVAYERTSDKISVVCPTHGEFFTTAASHLRGGCPKCRESKGERKIRIWLEENKIDYVYEEFKMISNRERYFDFYLPHNNLMIEYNGQHHYFPVSFGGNDPQSAATNFKNSLRSDYDKKRWCVDNGVALLIIPYWQRSIVSKILTEFIQNGKRIVTPAPQKVVEHYAMRAEINRNLLTETL